MEMNTNGSTRGGCLVASIVEGNADMEASGSESQTVSLFSTKTRCLMFDNSCKPKRQFYLPSNNDTYLPGHIDTERDQ